MTKPTNSDCLYRDHRDAVAAEAIKHELHRWGHDLSDSLIALVAARTLDALDRQGIENG